MATTYLVSYDLNKPIKDYPSLISAIERYENYCRILKSQWLIYSDSTAERIFEYLRHYIDADDELFVCEVTYDCFGKFSNPQAQKWIDLLRQV